MNTKIILSTAAGAVFNFLGGWFVFGILLSNFYLANTKTYEGLSKAEMPDLPFIFLSGIFNAYLANFVIRKAGQGFSFATGFKFGLVVYLCMAAWVNFSVYAFYNLMNLTLVFTDIFVQAIFGGVTGGIMALVMGAGKKA
ncbi:hypothetical protein WSM22_35780 [Cytophagales bacterium WSM2-2]|nr:hypothetical protein WSM22_35780 [Cytophagales bacterium WSM2-2]